MQAANVRSTDDIRQGLYSESPGNGRVVGALSIARGWVAWYIVVVYPEGGVAEGGAA